MDILRYSKDIFTPVSAGEEINVIELKDGHGVLRTVLSDASGNPYGFAHGGAVYTICDTLAGATALSLEAITVTLDSSIHYLKAVKLHEELSFISHCIHNGSSTKIIDVDVYNEKEDHLVSARFTMFVKGKATQDLFGE